MKSEHIMKLNSGSTPSKEFNKDVLKSERYLLYLDILGFKELVNNNDSEEIFSKIDNILQNCIKCSEINFNTIHFSDTFILYQEMVGYADWAFLDVYIIAQRLLSTLLANGIPARGVISFGEFDVRSDTSGKHQVYFGCALIEAYTAEQSERWIGVTVLESAWKEFEKRNPQSIRSLEQDRVVLMRKSDNTLLLNPFRLIVKCFEDYQIGQLEEPYLESDVPEFRNEILGFKFLRERKDHYANEGDFSGSASIKYHLTDAFLHQILGADLYEWGVNIISTET